MASKITCLEGELSLGLFWVVYPNVIYLKTQLQNAS